MIGIVVILPLFVKSMVLGVPNCKMQDTVYKKGVTQSTLEANFINPPTNAKPYVWWHWMGSNFSKTGITKDLEAMKSMGIGGATIFNIASAVQESHVPTLNNPFPAQTYRSEAYWDAIKHAAAEAQRLGLEIGLHNTAGYSTTGGPWITEEKAMQRLVWTKVEVTGGNKIELDLQQGVPPIFEGWGSPKTKAIFYKDIAVLAMPVGSVTNQKDVIDISAAMQSNGKLSWQAPQGKWIIYRMGHAPTMANPHPLPDDIIGKSLEVDKMSLEHNEFHWNQVLEPLKKHVGDYIGKSFKHILIDSYEADMQNWTPTFRQEFINRKGYDPLAWLLTFDRDKNDQGPIINNKNETDNFTQDFSEVVDQLFIDNGWKVGKRMVQDAGLTLQFEPYTGPFSILRGTAVADLPMGEFWTHLPGINIQIPAAAHAAGKKIIGAEAFTGWPMNSQYTEDPEFLKPTSSWAFATGVNRLILHTWVHQPFDDKYQPAMSMGWWGTHFGRHQTWFEPGKAFLQYLSRAQVMLQYGEPVSDMLCVGEVRNLQEDAIDPYDFIHQNISLVDGKIKLPSGRMYSAIRVSNSVKATPALLEKIKLLQTGNQDIAPDFIIEKADTTEAIKILHRKGIDGDFYFVTNLHKKSQDIRISFKQKGLQPELWQAEDGSRIDANIWEEKGERTTVDIHLNDFQTVFVVFKKPIVSVKHAIKKTGATVYFSDGTTKVMEPNFIKSKLVTAKWQVSMAPKLEPPFVINLDTLANFGAHPDKRIHYFAGTATYRTSIDIPAFDKTGTKLLLNLGSVHDIVSVTINGTDLGVVWYPPYQIDISKTVKLGNNKVEIAVTNNWANKLIGDEQEPEDMEWGTDRGEFGRAIKSYPDWFIQNKPRPSSNRKTFSIWHYYRKGDVTKPAGLLGPVQLIFERKQIL